MEKYKKLELIGRGSFGCAYLAERKNDPNKKLYVIKEIRIDPRDQQAAVREARLLAALDHPNIISCKEYFMVQPLKKVLCIVTEYADGGDLRKLLELHRKHGQPMTEEQALDLFVQICLALKHVHDRKILHRDIKPDNIFLMRSHVVKLGDFGVAKVLSNTLACADTQTGTPYYTSPEICLGKPYNHKTDVWSLGCVLYEMVTQTHAFDGRNQRQLFQNIAEGTYDTSRLNQLTPKLKELIMQMLSKTPRERPSVQSILMMPLIRDRIQLFLSERVMQDELAHTVLHGQHLFHKPKCVSSPRAMKHPPPPPIPIIKPRIHERQPVVRGYAAPTAVVKQRGEVLAARNDRVQALIMKQRELAEIRIIQEKKARLAKKQADIKRMNEMANRRKSPPKVTPHSGAEAKRRQLIEEKAVRDLPAVPYIEKRNERDFFRKKMAQDIKERKKNLREGKNNDLASVILVQAIKEEVQAVPPPPPVQVNHIIPKYEAITPPNSTYFHTTTDASNDEPVSLDQVSPCAKKDIDQPNLHIEVTEVDVVDDEFEGNNNLEYERMLLQMKCVMEAQDEGENNDEDAEAKGEEEEGYIQLASMSIFQSTAFQETVRMLWANAGKSDEVQCGLERPTALSQSQFEDARWLCTYIQSIVQGKKINLDG